MKSLKGAKKTLFLTVIFTILLSMSGFAAVPKLDKTSVTMKVGQKMSSTQCGIILTVKNAKKVSWWFTDDPTVANIAPIGSSKLKCHVYAIGYGNANVSVKVDGRILTAKITVKDPAPGIKVAMPKSGYKKLTKAAKGRVSDVIAIAESQKGYTGLDKGTYKTSYFGSKWDTYELNKHDNNKSGAWCTDFASWCLFAARVPNTSGLFCIMNTYRKDRTVTWYYGNKYNSLYRYQPSYAYDKKGVTAFLKSYKVRGTLTAKTIMPGDIAIVKKGHHTTIVKKVNRTNGSVQVVEGNNNNKVTVDRWIPAVQVYAVARPAYNK